MEGSQQAPELRKAENAAQQLKQYMAGKHGLKEPNTEPK